MPRIVTAASIVARYGGKWQHHHGFCLCPAHKEKTGSLHVSETRDKRILVYCHAGCANVDVIAALRRDGMWGDGEVVTDPSHPYFATTRHDGMNSYADREKRQRASEIWDKALEAKGSKVEAYLRARGIRVPMSDQIRFAPALRHSEARRDFPCMVARLADNQGFCAVQRTFLDRALPHKAVFDESSFKAKKSLGTMGASAVRLKMPAGDRLGLAEGIETALSAFQLYMVPTWATCSANRLGKIEFPETIRSIVIFGDSGDVGRRTAFEAAEIYERKGYHTEVVFPAADFPTLLGGDFNDALKPPA